MKNHLDEELNVPQPDEPIGLIDFEKIVRPASAKRKRKGIVKSALIVAPLVMIGAGTAAALLGDDRIGVKDVPLITADGRPVKERPEQPGGMQVPHQDKLVFGRAGTAEQETEKPQILAVSEDPNPIPRVAPEPLAPVSYVPAPLKELESSTAGGQDSGFQPARYVGNQPTINQPQPVVVPDVPATGTPAMEKTAADSSDNNGQPLKPYTISLADPDSQPRQEATPGPATREATQTDESNQSVAKSDPVQPESTKTKRKGRWMVQIAAMKSQTEAQEYWQDKRGQHPEVLGDLDLVIHKIVRDDTTYFRVRGGAFKAKSQARKRCRSAKSQGLDCFVVSSR